MPSDKRIEVLCATMGQSDFSKRWEMGIARCDAILANQADCYGYCEQQTPDGTTRLFTTPTRGVGKNRNFALALAKGDILLFADDDLQYEPDMPDIVAGAFERYPDADLIVFGAKLSKGGKVYKTKAPHDGKLPFRKALRYGTYSMAVRRQAVLRHNLHFSELFGGGCLYSYGEDSDFIVQCFRKRMRVYGCSSVIAATRKDASTCFTGYGEKYYFDKGALVRHSLKGIAYPYMVRLAMQKVDTSLTVMQRLKLLWQGYRSFPRLMSYDEWAGNRP